MSNTYFTHKVNVYDLAENLICWASFSSRVDAEKYRVNLINSNLKHIGNVELEVYRSNG